MDLLAQHAARQPDAIALVEDDRALTWRDMVARRNRLAHALLGLGVQPGEHVAVYAENSLENLLVGAAKKLLMSCPEPLVVPELLRTLQSAAE